MSALPPSHEGFDPAAEPDPKVVEYVAHHLPPTLPTPRFAAAPGAAGTLKASSLIAPEAWSGLMRILGVLGPALLPYIKAWLDKVLHVPAPQTTGSSGT